MIKFIEVAHLYLNCDIYHRWSGIDESGPDKMNHTRIKLGLDDWIPALRPLSDMKLAEGIFCLKETFFDHVDYPESDFKLIFVGEQQENPRICINNDFYMHDLTFGNKTGSIWSTDKQSSHVKIKPTVFLYLLNQGFDLFGLIESKQALNKTAL